MTANEKFLTQRQRYQSVTLPQDFSDEEMARDWTLSEADKKEVSRYRTNSRLLIATALCRSLVWTLPGGSQRPIAAYCELPQQPA